MSKMLFALLISFIGYQAQSADTTPIVQGSVFRLYKNGTKKLLNSHEFYMEEPGLAMLQTDSIKVSCKFGTLLSSSSQPYKGIQCSRYDGDGNHLGWAYNAYFPWILDHPSENKFEDTKGREYSIRFEAIPQNEMVVKADLGVQIKYWQCNFAKSQDSVHWVPIDQAQFRIFEEFGPHTNRSASLKDSSGLVASCNSKTTGSGSRIYQELNCAIQDQNRNELAQKNLLMGDSLQVDVEHSNSYYTVQCVKRSKDI